MKKIKITISKDGTSTQFEAEGFSGKGCIEATKKFMDKIGQVSEQKLTNDYHKKEEAGISISNF